MKELAKTYSPKDFEDRIYKNWEEKGYFHAKADPKKKPYTIVIPPPNITGQLHMGHALNNTYQDILIRWRRMQGYSALWLPGTDHASIATEARVVAALKEEEGKTKEEIGRDVFLARTWKWREVYGGKIVQQLRKLGSSCDWERERFTLDDGCSNAVKKVFVKLYEDGKIYHGVRIINWCPNCRTSISDIECIYEEKDGSFWHIRYPFTDGTGYVEVATTRPETMLGDTAVAVNPNDERYKDIIGKTVKLPLTDREIPVIADEYVDMEFGTGVVKITPAHDPNDFEVGLRHSLPIISMMNDDATVNENGGKYKNLDRYKARALIVKDLEAENLLSKIEAHTHNVGTCERCKTVIEPKASLQWFVKMDELAEPALDAVKKGTVKFIPKRFENSYFSWMENIRDWCISRQLWWGHRIPAYYCQNINCRHEEVALDKPEKCPKCGSNMIQDADTLDTWFSSALWPFSTLGWPEETEDFKYFYPTNTLVTAPDIIFFWVARMIFSGLEYTGKVPFDTVIFNGIVRDEQGRKMSKSLDNGTDPLEVIEKYGADALRMLLVSGNAPGNDMRFSESKITASRNFANKLWNASRFILMNLSDGFIFNSTLTEQALTIEDKWLLKQYNDLVRNVTNNLEAFEMGVAVGNVTDFIWNIYCDWYIELVKPRITAGGGTALAAQNVLIYVMRGILKLLHPFMPFITEEIWSAIPLDFEKESPSIMLSAWEEYREDLNYLREYEDFDKIVTSIGGIRSKRAELNVPMSKKIGMEIETDLYNLGLFENCKIFFEKLAGADKEKTTISEKITDTEGKVAVVTDTARIFIPMGELVDTEKELLRLEKERAAAQKDINFLQSKLNNKGFTEKAPAAQVENERVKLKKAEEKMVKIMESINGIK